MARSVEKRAGTVEDAVQEALAELGVSREEADVEVLSSGRRALFGAGRRAHVRVVVRQNGEPSGSSQQRVEAHDPEIPPTTNAGKAQEDGVTDIEDVTDVTEDQADTAEAPAEEELTPEERMNQLDEEADIAADFLEGLLDLLEMPGDIEIEVGEDQALVNVSEVGSGLLIGRRGATLDALQELVRSATQRQTERRAHVRVDVEGYRERQLDKLRDKCRDAIAEVRETGEPVRLEPMDPYERKMMHDLISRTGGVSSSSEGSEPKRRVVIHPED